MKTKIIITACGAMMILATSIYTVFGSDKSNKEQEKEHSISYLQMDGRN